MELKDIKCDCVRGKRAEMGFILDEDIDKDVLMEQLITENLRLEDKVKELNNTIESLEEAVEDLEFENSNLENEIDFLEDEIDDLRGQIEDGEW